MLALGLFLVGMISILVLFPMAVSMQQDGARQAGAMTVAHNVLSELRTDRSIDFPIGGASDNGQFVPFAAAAGRPIPINLVNPHTGRLVSTDAGYDYRLAYRRVDPRDAFGVQQQAGERPNIPVRDWKVEVAVFVFPATGDDSVGIQKLSQPLNIINPTPDGFNLATGTDLARNSVFLAQHTTSRRTFVMRVVGPRRVEPHPPQTGQYDVYYIPGGADAVLTGWVR